MEWFDHVPTIGEEIIFVLTFVGGIIVGLVVGWRLKMYDPD